MDLAKAADWQLVLNLIFVAAALATVVALIRLVHDREDLHVKVSVDGGNIRIDLENRGGRGSIFNGPGFLVWDFEPDGTPRTEATIAPFPSSRGIGTALSGKPILPRWPRKVRTERDMWLLSCDQVRKDLAKVDREGLPDRYRITSATGSFGSAELSRPVKLRLADCLKGPAG